jgi:channel protein (hemolysin III family)
MDPFIGLNEPVSSLTHLIGAVAFACMGYLLLVRCRNQPGRPYLAVYSLTCVLLLVVSGVYHALAEGAARNVMLRLDLAAIFLLIAGTFTAVHGTLLTGKKHWGVLGFVWLVAVVGVVLSITSYDSIPEGCWLLMYLLQGWSGLFSSIMIWRRHGPSYVILPFCGGVIFSIGGLIEAAERLVLIPQIVGAHEVFHLAVLLGMSCFWIYIFDAVGIEERARLSKVGEKAKRAALASPRAALAEEAAAS